jgi:hypothetical protein
MAEEDDAPRPPAGPEDSLMLPPKPARGKSEYDPSDTLMLPPKPDAEKSEKKE